MYALFVTSVCNRPTILSAFSLGTAASIRTCTEPATVVAETSPGATPISPAIMKTSGSTWNVSTEPAMVIDAINRCCGCVAIKLKLPTILPSGVTASPKSGFSAGVLMYGSTTRSFRIFQMYQGSGS